jgi:ATP-dependent helicase/nuclease subunit B
MSGSSRLYTIPSGANFAAELARGVRDRYANPDDPFALADCLILLPTRRAIRALERAFAPEKCERGVLLPRMRALGDWDGGDGDADDPSAWAGRELTPPPMTPVERQLALMEMVLAWHGRKAPAAERKAMDPALALGLAQDLAGLFDAAAAEQMDWSKLRDLVPSELALHWEQTLQFLKLLTEDWPNWLNARGRSDPAQHRDRQMRDLAAHWTAKPPPFPVIIAGSTGSVKATQELMRAVLRMPRGAVILPGVDLKMDAATWDVLGPDHPQFVMRELLHRLDYTRTDISAWTDAQGTPARAKLISELMRPAVATGAWREFVAQEKDNAARMFDGLTWVESATPNAEALTIATILREALETPDATAALITPNRNLARRVASHMRRWGVDADDSAGRPLSKTPLGGFLSLIMQAAAEDFAPVPLLALLKHPFCTLGLPAQERHRIVLKLERAALRGPRPALGLTGVAAALDSKADPRIHGLLQILQEAFAPACDGGAKGLAAWSAAIRAIADALNTGDGSIWTDEAGAAAARLFDEIELIPFLNDAYPFDAAARVLDRLMDGVAVRLRASAGSRIDILGPLEARLQTADVVVLGGLNEPGWPGLATVDGWLSRPMRKDAGLSQPERRIGQSAHDFAEAACAPRVFLSRALKEEGGPANPSRWLVRLDALAKAMGMDKALRRAPYAEWADALDRPASFDKIEPPLPKPPVHARARNLYVTAVEQWVRDPYAHYVRRILNLAPLDPIDQDPSAREKGTFIHRALELFVLRHPRDLPAGAETILEELGREAAREQKVPPGVVALWWPRFQKIVKWFANEERARRPLLSAILTETKGQAVLADLNFTLSAKADRIEIRKDGGVSILDYKTGQAPTQKELETGLSAQFPLEAWIATQGGFPDVNPRGVPDFMALRLTGKGDGGKIETYKNIPELVTGAIDGLKRRIAKFDDPNTGYPSKVAVKFQRYADDYDYIARSAETALDAEEPSA